MKQTFEQWLDRVDAEIQAIAGVSLLDLPDCCYQDWYNDEISVKRAAKKAIRTAQE
jgi:hypothetical protein